jgi:uncharacterized protein YlxP (DUF503 family)
MSVKEKKAIIRWIVNEIHNKKNLAAIYEVATTDLILHTTNGDYNVPEGWKQVSNKFLTAFPDFNITIEDLIA